MPINSKSKTACTLIRMRECYHRIVMRNIKAWYSDVQRSSRRYRAANKQIEVFRAQCQFSFLEGIQPEPKGEGYTVETAPVKLDIDPEIEGYKQYQDKALNTIAFALKLPAHLLQGPISPYQQEIVDKVMSKETKFTLQYPRNVGAATCLHNKEQYEAAIEHEEAMFLLRRLTCLPDEQIKEAVESLFTGYKTTAKFYAQYGRWPTPTESKNIWEYGYDITTRFIQK